MGVECGNFLIALHIMDIHSLDDLLRAAIKAAEAACREIMEVYSGGIFQTEYKQDESPLTIADKRSHTIITDLLCEHFSFPLLSEEGRNIPYETRSSWKRFWLIDPLDGTKEFIKKNGEFTVNIAFVEDQKPVLGVMAVPATSEVYYGSGTAAFVKTKDRLLKIEKRIDKVDLRQSGLRVVASRTHMNNETKRFIDSLNEPTLISVGSSLKFMLLAMNKADVYPRFGPTMEWDTAAAQAIIEPLGIQVLQKETHVPLAYNKPSLVNPDFICY